MEIYHTKINLLISVLWQWYQEHSRNFPWRGEPSAYEILISEILLQQTFARKVVPIYVKILKKYPEVKDLELANSEELLEIIRPLGLLYRAKLLLRVAQYIENNCEGLIPCDQKKLLAIPGIGAYTSASILCHACKEKIIPIDTNIQRVVCRLMGWIYPVKQAKVQHQIEGFCSIAANSLETARWMHYALLDFASEICKFYNPICNKCPINHICSYYSSL